MKKTVKTFSKNISKDKRFWDQAIKDAKQRIKDLQMSISVYEDRKRAGDPWPGERKAS
jgi:hypothetical protein